MEPKKIECSVCDHGDWDSEELCDACYQAECEAMDEKWERQREG